MFLSYSKKSNDKINSMKSKTIILSADNEQGRGILTLYEEDDLLKCKIRLYNIKPLNRYCKLGIYHNSEVFSANLLEKEGAYHSSFVGDFDMNKDFFCALVDTSKNNEVIVSGGTYSGYYFNNQTDIFDKIEKEQPHFTLGKENVTLSEAEGSPKKNTILYQGDSSSPLYYTQNDIEQECKADCEHCKYKEYFYSMQENVERIEENLEDYKYQDTMKTNAKIESSIKSASEEKNIINKNEIKKENNNILSSLISQFDYVFNNYNPDETLNNLIANGKFVKIEENQEQYSIGAIYEEEKMKYICYAVYSNYNTPAPNEIGEHYQWLPIDKEDPLSEGYYIVFQDANDLKIVEM